MSGDAGGRRERNRQCRAGEDTANDPGRNALGVFYGPPGAQAPNCWFGASG